MELPEILDIVLQYLKVLAWPIVVFTLALVYRKPVITLLQRLKKYSGWGQTVELDDNARDLREDSEEALEQELTPPQPEPVPVIEPPAVIPAPTPPADAADAVLPSESTNRKRSNQIAYEARQELFSMIASNDPAPYPTAARRAVSKAWRNLLETTAVLARWLDLPPGERETLNAVTFALVNRGLLKEKTALIAFRLTDLQNSIMNREDGNLNLSVVADFINSAANVQEILDRLLTKLKQDLAEQQAAELQQDDPHT